MSEKTERKDGETSLGEHLRMVAGSIVADGKVDFDETTRLLEILKPLGEFDAKAVELRKTVEEVRADGVVTGEESAKLVALIRDFMAEAAHWSLVACPACKRMVPVSSLQGAARRCPECGAVIPRTGDGMFREAAIKKAAHPFSKEQIPGVFRLPVVLTAAILAVVIASFCVWCGIGSIAENVHGAGILMHKGRYVALTSPGEGLVVSFDVKVGDSVTNGQKVGVLYSKTDAEQLLVANRRLEKLKADYDRIADLHVERDDESLAGTRQRHVATLVHEDARAVHVLGNRPDPAPDAERGDDDRKNRRGKDDRQTEHARNLLLRERMRRLLDRRLAEYPVARPWNLRPAFRAPPRRALEGRDRHLASADRTSRERPMRGLGHEILDERDELRRLLARHDTVRTDLLDGFAELDRLRVELAERLQDLQKPRRLVEIDPPVGDNRPGDHPQMLAKARLAVFALRILKHDPLHGHFDAPSTSAATTFVAS